MRINRKYLIRALSEALLFTEPHSTIKALHCVHLFPTMNTLRLAASNGHQLYIERMMSDGADYWPEPRYLHADTVKALIAELKRAKGAEVDVQFQNAFAGTGEIAERWQYLMDTFDRAMPVPVRIGLPGVQLPAAAFARAMKALSARASVEAPTMQVVQLLPGDSRAYLFTQEDVPYYHRQILTMCLHAEDLQED